MLLHLNGPAFIRQSLILLGGLLEGGGERAMEAARRNRTHLRRYLPPVRKMGGPHVQSAALIKIVNGDLLLGSSALAAFTTTKGGKQNPPDQFGLSPGPNPNFSIEVQSTDSCRLYLLKEKSCMKHPN